jgi:hypothetical protein
MAAVMIPTNSTIFDMLCTYLIYTYLKFFEQTAAHELRRYSHEQYYISEPPCQNKFAMNRPSSDPFTEHLSIMKSLYHEYQKRDEIESLAAVEVLIKEATQVHNLRRQQGLTLIQSKSSCLFCQIVF